MRKMKQVAISLLSGMVGAALFMQFGASANQNVNTLEVDFLHARKGILVDDGLVVRGRGVFDSIKTQRVDMDPEVVGGLNMHGLTIEPGFMYFSPDSNSDNSSLTILASSVSANIELFHRESGTRLHAAAGDLGMPIAAMSMHAPKENGKFIKLLLGTEVGPNIVETEVPK